MGKIFGISCLSIRKGTWNNDFDGMSRKTSDGVIYATDKSRKYSIREDFKANQTDTERVLITAMKEDDKYLGLDTILERNGLITNLKLDKKNLINKFIDVRLFGAVLAAKGNNYGITGPFSMNFGTNVYEEDGVITNNESMIQITSYLAGGKTGAQKTIGEQNIVEKAVLSFPFVFNPVLYRQNFKEFDDTISDSDLDVILKNDIAKLKESMNYDVTNMRSCSKMGSNNLFSIFIETTEDDTNINYLALDKISVEEEDTPSKLKFKVDIRNIVNFVEKNKEIIKSFEIYTVKTPAIEIDFGNTGIAEIKEL